MDGCKHTTVHGPPLQARVVAANRAVLANLRGDPGAHGNEQGAGKMQNRTGAKNDEGSRHDMAKEGRCRQHSRQMNWPAQALSQKHSQHTIRPAQALQQTPADDPAGTGLAVEVGGGSAVVLATQKAGSDLPNRLPLTYRLCLSLAIPTPLICTNLI